MPTTNSPFHPTTTASSEGSTRMQNAAPPRPAPKASRRQPVASETFSQVQSLVQRLQSLLPTEGPRGQVVGVTSCVRQEGVSVVAANLALCAAESCPGKVLLIDANPRNPSVASRFGVKRITGLMDCLSGKAAFHECFANSAQPNLSILPAGSESSRSSRQRQERTATSFETLRQGFGLIVLDLPPANEMDEMMLMSRQVDGVLLVVEAERIRRQVAQRVQRRLEQANVRLLGVVLNKRPNHVPEWLYRRL